MAKAGTAAPAGARQDRRKAWRLVLAGCVALWGSVAPAWGAPTVTQLLNISPRQKGVDISTPAAGEDAKCKVELIKGARKGSGWLLRDGSGKPLRVFFDTNDDGKVDVWSYYKDGVEVFREIDTRFSGRHEPDQYRWLNTAGMKWGIDENHDGHISSWKAISPEEVSQELLQALVTRDAARFQALLITEEELKALGLPSDQLASVQKGLKAAPATFQETANKLAASLTVKTNWIHLETKPPQCLPADQTGAGYDLVKHGGGTVLFDNGGKNDWVQTGEIWQVGTKWRLVEGPRPGAAPVEKDTPEAPSDPEAIKLIQELTDLDSPKNAPSGSDNAAMVLHHLKRADVLERIVGRVKAEEREPWIRQVADSLSTAAQASSGPDSASMRRLLNLEKQLTDNLPAGHNLAGYVTFREMQADYTLRTNGKSPDFKKVQQDWLERLTKFSQTYPKAEDTPDALLQAAQTSEFLEKDTEAKNLYATLARNFADKPQGQKAAGAIRRLEAEGKPIKLAAPMLTDANVAFDVDQLNGKLVVVYYWATWNSNLASDVGKLKALLETYRGKGVELVCVNLDNTAEEARKFLQRQPVPGTHLHQDGGLESKLAIEYGIQVLPQTFLVGKDGKVLNRNAQVSTLEEEVKKQLK
jgi:hypothetical protein